MATDKTAAVPAQAQERARPSAGRGGSAQRVSRGPGRFQRMLRYLGEVRTELKKTTWPGKPELISQTQVVLGLLLIIGVFIATWDMLLGMVFRGLLRLLNVNP